MFAHFHRWHAVTVGLILGIALGVVTLTCTSQQPAKEQEPTGKDKKKPAGDFKEVLFLDLGVVLLSPDEDKKTGFSVAGKNSTFLVRNLKRINNRTIAALEKDMRPGEFSMAGFLGKDEKLLEVLGNDNEYVVDAQGMLHQELARHLYALEAVWHKLGGTSNSKEPVRCTYCDRRYEVRVDATRGHQKSPFEDGTKTNTYVYLTNVDNGKKLEYSGLIPMMVERYGFYEGKGTSFRVEPKQIVEVFDFLKATAK